MASKIRKFLIDGLVVVLPIGITGYLLWLGYRLIESYLGKSSYLGSRLSPYLQSIFGVEWIPGLSIIYTSLVILFLGLLARFYFWRFIQRYLDRLFCSLPLVNKLYPHAQRMAKAVLGNEDYSSFQEPVLIEYPRKGTERIGFITNRKGHQVSVYIFTAPDPFTGKVLIVPREDVTPLDMSVEEAVRKVISMGIADPDCGDQWTELPTK